MREPSAWCELAARGCYTCFFRVFFAAAFLLAHEAFIRLPIASLAALLIGFRFLLT